jgi:metal-responsive CopG/Arc/MetJ family transcriptional regulator
MYGARLSDELVAKIDKWAKDQGVSRSEAIRRLVALALKSKA